MLSAFCSLTHPFKDPALLDCGYLLCPVGNCSYSAGVVIGAGAGMVVSAGVTEIADFDDGLVMVKEAKMLITQMNTAKLQVAFSMKSVVLR